MWASGSRTRAVYLLRLRRRRRYTRRGRRGIPNRRGEYRPRPPTSGSRVAALVSRPLALRPFPTSVFIAAACVCLRGVYNVLHARVCVCIYIGLYVCAYICASVCVCAYARYVGAFASDGTGWHQVDGDLITGRSQRKPGDFLPTFLRRRK